MEYNTKRNKLIIPEYGRNVQKMIEYCMTIEDRQKRNDYAKTIIVAMSQVNQAGRDSMNYLHKLWDHLFIISDYKLDIDSPYPKPQPEQAEEKPTPLKYKNSQITYRPYGALLESMIKKITQLPEGEEKNILIELSAQEMKKLYLQYNINTCDDEVLKKHFETLSDGKIKLPESFQFKTTRSIISSSKKKNSNQKTTALNKNKKVGVVIKRNNQGIR
ncbi:MAG: DUF4290 domain-containing protein [Bacteroidales bacterium]|nr:DUF4290 domain-containing protein [Bacteroidales bacterium]